MSKSKAMGMVFESFDPLRWKEWSSGVLSLERAETLRNALLWDEQGKAPAALVDRIAAIGIEATYRELPEAEHPQLDALVIKLFSPEGLESELDVRAYSDPLNRKAIDALDTGSQVAQLLLTGRRLATNAGTTEARYVVYTPDEALQLAAELEQAARKAGIFEELGPAMAELKEDARAGRSVVARFS